VVADSPRRSITLLVAAAVNGISLSVLLITLAALSDFEGTLEHLAPRLPFAALALASVRRLWIGVLGSVLLFHVAPIGYSIWRRLSPVGVLALLGTASAIELLMLFSYANLVLMALLARLVPM